MLFVGMLKQKQTTHQLQRCVVYGTQQGLAKNQGHIEKGIVGDRLLRIFGAQPDVDMGHWPVGVKLERHRGPQGRPVCRHRQVQVVVDGAVTARLQRPRHVPRRLVRVEDRQEIVFWQRGQTVGEADTSFVFLAGRDTCRGVVFQQAIIAGVDGGIGALVHQRNFDTGEAILPGILQAIAVAIEPHPTLYIVGLGLGRGEKHG
jgi:hypothetical protein